jgi:hypothetical protein
MSFYYWARYGFLAVLVLAVAFIVAAHLLSRRMQSR